MNSTRKKAISIFWTSLLLILCVSDLCLGASTEERLFDVGYISDASNSVNVMETHDSEQDRWVLNNFSYFDDGIYHGSDVPESEWTLQERQSHHRTNWLELKQSITFKPQQIMSGSSVFWIRFPVRFCDDGSCAGADNRIFDTTYTQFWFNNTDTNQSFQYSGSYLYNLQTPTQYRHDFSHGRVVMELNLPVYSGYEYTLTFRGLVRDGKKATIYTCYGDLGKDLIISSHWNYQYYDTAEGEEVTEINQKLPLDLGYTFIFQEGLSSTGITGIEMNTPENGYGQFYLNTSWNKTDNTPTFYLFLPIQPVTNRTNLTMDIEIWEYREPFTQNRIQYFDDVSWNHSGIMLIWDHQITVNDTHFMVRIYPQNNASQKYITILQDYKREPSGLVETFAQYDGQSYYNFQTYFLSWRGTNITFIPRPTRSIPDTSCIRVIDIKGKIPYRRTRGDWGLSAITNGLNNVQKELQTAYDGVSAVATLRSDHYDEAGRTEAINNVFNNLTEDGEFTLSNGLYHISEETGTGGSLSLPTITPPTNPIETAKAWMSEQANKVTDAVNSLSTTITTSLSGTVMELGSLVKEKVGNIFSTVKDFGANIIKTIKKIVSVIISLAETILSIFVTIVAFIMFIVLVMFGLFIYEIIFLMSKADFKGIYQLVFNIFSRAKGGGEG